MHKLYVQKAAGQPHIGGGGIWDKWPIYSTTMIESKDSLPNDLFSLLEHRILVVVPI